MAGYGEDLGLGRERHGESRCRDVCQVPEREEVRFPVEILSLSTKLVLSSTSSLRFQHTHKLPFSTYSRSSSPYSGSPRLPQLAAPHYSHPTARFRTMISRSRLGCAPASLALLRSNFHPTNLPMGQTKYKNSVPPAHIPWPSPRTNSLSPSPERSKSSMAVAIPACSC